MPSVPKIPVLPKGRVSLSIKQKEFKANSKRLRTTAPQPVHPHPYIVSAVFENEDVMTVVLESIGRYRLMMLQKFMMVCKLWHKIVQNLETPIKELRLLMQDPERLNLVFDGKEKFNLSRILWGFQGQSSVKETLRQVVGKFMDRGGWKMREVQRLGSQGDRLWHAGQTWTVPPLGFVPSRNPYHWVVDGETFAILLNGTDQQREAFWTERLVMSGMDLLRFVLDPSKMDTLPLDLCKAQAYAEIRTLDAASVHPIHVQVPDASYRAAWQRWMPADSTFVPPPTLDPKALKWELL